MELMVDDLTKNYKDKLAVNKVTLTLTKGVYGLLGGNGAGKTTFMRMLCGVLKPTSGKVEFDGMDVSSEGYRNHLGYLPQDFGYYPEFSAIEFLCYMSLLKGMPKRYGKDKAEALLELVSLSEVSKKKIKTFSGGMKQRLGIAQALLNDPGVLILDEPTAGLDPKERVRFRNLISQLGSDRIVILSTHIVTDIESIAKTVLLMKDGSIVGSGSVEQVVSVIDGKVYECIVSEEEADSLMKKCTVINVRSQGEGTFLRLVSDYRPCDGAEKVQVTLEDVYLYYFGETGVIEGE